MDRLLAGKQALVVGGAGGIGGAITTALSEHGCHVVATGVDDMEVRRFREQHVADRVETSILDVTDAQAVQQQVEQLSKLDILVNAAGIIVRGQREFELPEFSRVIEVNLVGTMRMCMACQEALHASQGCVLNIASMLSFFGSASAPAYSSSKGGIAQLTKSLAVAWAPRGVRVNAIAPGWIETELTAPLVADAETSRRLVQRTPLGRWGQPDDVGGAAVFLCSPWAKFITGVVLPVDGGYSVA
jgi:NAD(P)-dependent dehydrogenase (short-subunit alcohol dehydrogenase family)